MTKRWMILMVFGALLVVTACGYGDEDAASKAAYATIDADALMAALVTEWDDAMAAGDVERAVALYVADDAVVMPPDAPALGGADGLAAHFGDMFSGGGLVLTNQHERVLSSGGLVIARGNYIWTKTDESGSQMDEVGKWTCIARRNEQGDLEVVRNIWNRDAPPPGAEPPLVVAESGPAAAEDAACLDSPSAVDAMFVSHFTAGNVGQLVANHTESGARMAPGLPSMDGREQVAAYLQSFVDNFAERELELTETGEIIEDDLGYTWGQYRVVFTPADGGDVSENAGKFIAVSQRGEDGCWRNEWVLWNGDEPWPETGA